MHQTTLVVTIEHRYEGPLPEESVRAALEPPAHYMMPYGVESVKVANIMDLDPLNTLLKDVM